MDKYIFLNSHSVPFTPDLQKPYTAFPLIPTIAQVL